MTLMKSRRCMCPRKDHALCRAQSLALCDRAASEKWHTTARLFLRRRYVRFGSKADMCGAPTHVRFTPESGHSLAAPLRPNKDVIHVLASEYVKKSSSCSRKTLQSSPDAQLLS